ncbi:MAG TPA: PLP-dependent aspartate aminotransferase family protein [Verrucomicrobiae bacterium]|jgi:cystathionine beta-lyase/cystathionine gamma-synthase|nr:PLP-dependent aspartate aminotransferase family protein [Verrucomicrobiae bacterium]
MADPDARRRAADHTPPRGFATRAIRAAHRLPVVDQSPTSVPIYQTVTFSAADAEELGAVATREIPGYAYGRLDNPTVVAFAAAVAELEGAEAGFAFASGMGAIHAALGTVLSAGDRVLATQASYGTTRAQLGSVFGRLGVTTEFVDVTDLAAVEVALAAAPTRVLYAETIANPTIVVADHVALADLAHRFGALYIVDNTFASPYLCRPVELGADLVVESATKYLAGHSDVMAGVVCGATSLIHRVRDFQVDTGASLDPHAAFLAMRGLSTLALRMERHSATAAALGAWLEAQPGIRRVWYPALPTHPQHEVAARLLARGGGMLAFELDGGRAAGAAVIDTLEIPVRTASLGSVFTIVSHPPSTTHRQLDDAQLVATGITPGLLRCSVGLEDLDDLIADFSRALAAARAATDPTGEASTGRAPRPSPAEPTPV